MVVLGWVLIVLGILFLLVGLIEAVRKLRSPRALGGSFWDIILALINGGFALIGIGLALLVIGLRLIGVDVFPAMQEKQESA